VRRYAKLFWIQLRASLAVAMQYRVDFFLDGVISLFWLAWTLVPLYVVFHGRPSVAGWTFPEAFLVAAWFTVLRGVLEGAINPSLVQISEQIRTGTLDFVLIKPADGQFLVSTAKFAPWKIFDVGAGFVMAGIAFHELGRTPALGDVALALVLLATAVLVMYAMWILVVSASFWVVRLDNLSYLLGSIFDAARWPLNVFRGFWRLLFTFVIPLGLMTTYPAQAILGTLDARTAIAAVVGAVAFAVLARVVWLRAISRYTSASS
jgi:ABC-2 type transport system permease protein